MRAHDFLFESGLTYDSLSRHKNYWNNLLKLVSLRKPIELVDGTKITVDPTWLENAMDIWDGENDATPEQIALLKKLYVNTAKGYYYPIPKILKSKEIRAAGPDSENEKYWNLGNVIEGIMGAAVCAKFMNPKKEITHNDVADVLAQLRHNGGMRFSFSSKIGSNQLSFIMSLNDNDRNALVDSFQNPDNLKKYKSSSEIFKAYHNAATYVNTADTVATAIDRVLSNDNKNVVKIESEGGSSEKQKSTKADLFITINGKTERLLSLKSKTVPQVGQVSGHAFENLEEFFKSTVGFGLPSAMNTQEDFPQGSFKKVGNEVFAKGFTKAYKHIMNSLESTLKGDNEYKEYDFVTQIYESLRHHATLGEDVIIVYLSPSAKKAYTELKIGHELREALSNFDLKPQLSTPTTIKIIGTPKTALGKEMTGGQPQELVQLRSYTQKGGTVRNIIEIKKLLKTLADIEQINNRKDKSKIGHNGGPSLNRGPSLTNEPPQPKKSSISIQQQAPAQQQQAAQQAPVAAQQAPVAAQQQQAVQQQAPVAAQQQQAAQQQVAQPAVDPAKQKVDLSRSPLTAKWLSGR